MKTIKKLAAVLICIAVLFSFTACHITTPSTVLNVNGTDIPAGLYLMYQYEAYRNAASVYSEEQAMLSQEDQQEGDVDILRATIEGVLGEEWIANETIRLIKRHIWIDENATGENAMEQAEIDEALNLATEYYEYDDLLDDNGIGVNSYAQHYLAQSKYYSMSNTFIEAESENITAQEAKDYMDEIYSRIQAVTLPTTDETGMPLDDEKSAQVQQIADTLEQDLKDSDDVETLCRTALQDAFEVCGVEYNEDLFTQYYTTYFVTDDVNYYIDMQTASQIRQMDIGDSGQAVESSDPLVYVVIPNYESDEQFEEDYQYSMASAILQKEFDDTIVQECESYEVIELGNATEVYSAKKVKINLYY